MADPINVRPAMSPSARHNELCSRVISLLEREGAQPVFITALRKLLKSYSVLCSLHRFTLAENVALRGMLEARGKPVSDFKLEPEHVFEFVEAGDG